jgi:predicted nucleotidyltransferase
MLSLLQENLSIEQQVDLVKTKTTALVNAANPVRIILIGSASRKEMTTASDVDFVIVLKETADQKEIRKAIALSRKGDPWPQDVLLVTEEEFQSRSQIGGILWIAAQEGIEVFPEFKFGVEK